MMSKNYGTRERFIFSFVLTLFVSFNLYAQVEDYKNAELSIDERVNDLIARMTVQEKLNQTFCFQNPCM